MLFFQSSDQSHEVGRVLSFKRAKTDNREFLDQKRIRGESQIWALKCPLFTETCRRIPVQYLEESGKGTPPSGGEESDIADFFFFFLILEKIKLLVFCLWVYRLGKLKENLLKIEAY